MQRDSSMNRVQHDLYKAYNGVSMIYPMSFQHHNKYLLCIRHCINNTLPL